MSDTPLASLIAGLGSDDRAIQRAACNEAKERADGDPGLRASLRDLLRDGNPIARFSAAWVLFRLESPSLRVLPALLESLELGDPDLRWAATQMLCTLGRLQPEVYPVLLHEAQKSGSPLRRRMSLYALRELGPERPETAAVFASALDQGDAEVRRAALSSVAKLAECDPPLFDRVVEILRDDRDPRMRRIAAVVLPDLLADHPQREPDALRLLEMLGSDEDLGLARVARAAVARVNRRP